MNIDFKNNAAVNCAHYIYDKATQCFVDAQKPGTVQNTVQAGLRTFVGLTSIYYNYPASLAGATFATIKPGLARHILSATDGAITGLWNSCSFNLKAGLVITGVAAATVYDPTMVFTGLGTLFAAKLGGEIALRNFGKEEIAAKTRELEKAVELQ